MTPALWAELGQSGVTVEDIQYLENRAYVLQDFYPSLYKHNRTVFDAWFEKTRGTTEFSRALYNIMLAENLPQSVVQKFCQMILRQPWDYTMCPYYRDIIAKYPYALEYLGLAAYKPY